MLNQATNSSSAPSLTITYRALDSLKANPHNPRAHPKKQLSMLAKSIRAFGFIVPVLVDANLNVLAGHARVKAAIQVGLTDAPTICIDHLSADQAKAFTIADNRLSEIAAWDDEVLAVQLKELSEVDLDFDFEIVGFEVPEIDFRTEAHAAPSGDSDPADNVLVASGPVVCRPGMTFALGEHVICCGNALESDSYALLFDNRRAAVGITDSPYNVPIQGHVSGNGRFQHREFAMASGEMTEAEFTRFQETYLRNMAGRLKAGGLIYSFMDWRHSGEVLEAAKRLDLELMNIAAWVKPNPGMGSFYRSQHELCFVFKSGKPRHRNNIQLGKFKRNRSNVWTYPGANNAASTGEEGKLLSLHPTAKPVRLIADIILDCTTRGDIVLDPFLGSGSTLIASERVGRRCFGLEIDPAYVDTAIRRWQAFTGGIAVEVQSGLHFDALEPVDNDRDCRFATVGPETAARQPLGARSHLDSEA